MKILRIGHGNGIAAERIEQIVNGKTSSGRRWRQEANISGKLIDATAGHNTRSIIVMDTGHIVLSSLSPEEIKKGLGSTIS